MMARRQIADIYNQLQMHRRLTVDTLERLDAMQQMINDIARVQAAEPTDWTAFGGGAGGEPGDDDDG